MLILKAAKAHIRAENERLILEAGERIFAQHGFRGSTMQMIADQAGLPKANLHYYFDSKEKLYRRVVEKIFEIWLQAASSFENSDEPKEALKLYIYEKMQISRRHPYGSKVWANEVMQGAPIIQDFLETQLRSWTDGRIESIQAWIAAGKIRPVEPRWVMYMIWATTQHYADFGHQIETLNADAPLSEAQWEAASETVFEVIWNGLEPKQSL
ncbi:MAG: TetR family transcriptional regulator C-terminal domain-containing protein [Rhodobacteraceae bacterium]|nr:TetR family transcriptional regulator C-terminal domain-containing protein [Paracoccaceae bacterium]MBL6640393.1 TetR family transcriptional regulator C-terminal domain-containing protein [Paracoccaceae bacterium]MBL6789516.1 TetR family transcriptional regulator C-terminal domain-containing protein [Paracoccaceae bacterium]MBL6860205.1 TetR family transcriptional regulator C-terminal domain-containing protein [Paracoccaceae bacterium]